MGRLENRFDVTRRTISGRLEIGRTSYPLRSTFLGFFRPGKGDELGEFSVLEFGPEFNGSGANIDDAYVDWRNRVHCRFQELYAKRPFEMTDDERKVWRNLERRIDVAVYRNTTPLNVKQVGKVGAYLRPLPSQIVWEDGRKERVRPDQMPGEFMTYSPGQPFEAIVSRNPVDFQLIEVVSIRRTSATPRMRPEEFDELRQAIPTTASLPETDWD